MNQPIDKNTFLQCAQHGVRRPAFVCQHLAAGQGAGFVQPIAAFDPEWPFQDAWCDACEAVRAQEGEWNARSEAFAKVTVVCEGCLEEMHARSKPGG